MDVLKAIMPSGMAEIKLSHYIESSPTIIVTDHQRLQWLMSLKSLTGWLARWALQVPYPVHTKKDKFSSQHAVPEYRGTGHDIQQIHIEVPCKNPAYEKQLKNPNKARIINTFADPEKEDDIIHHLISHMCLFQNNMEEEAEEAHIVTRTQKNPQQEPRHL